MNPTREERLRQRLMQQKQELTARLERISANVRRRLEPDSSERAKQLEDKDVVDALGNDARRELAKISSALRKIESGEFGKCDSCGTNIDDARLEAHPYATECLDCAALDELIQARASRTRPAAR